MNSVIYYFSGTGNSLRAASRIASSLTDTDTISMRCDPKEVPATQAQTIGFVFPVYHWTMPEAAIRFVQALSINPKAYIFAVSTPGFINGQCFEVLAGILEQKGAALAYAKILYSVANLVAVYPPMPFPSLRVPQSEKKLTVIADEIVRKTHRDYPKAFVLTRLIYPHMMPKYRSFLPQSDRGFVITDRCVSCGICAKVCPCKNIVMANGKPTFLHQCSFCMACVAFCPQKAFTYVTNSEMKALIDDPLVRLMKLPASRKRYHHPYTTAADLAADKAHFS